MTFLLLMCQCCHVLEHRTAAIHEMDYVLLSTLVLSIDEGNPCIKEILFGKGDDDYDDGSLQYNMAANR
jgi:hypothetical protein